MAKNRAWTAEEDTLLLKADEKHGSRKALARQLDRTSDAVSSRLRVLRKRAMKKPPVKVIRHLPGTTLTPEVVLHRTLQKNSAVKAVVVVMQWENGSFAVDWSSMTLNDMCAASMLLHNVVMKEVNGEPQT